MEKSTLQVDEVERPVDKVKTIETLTEKGCGKDIKHWLNFPAHSLRIIFN